MADLGNLYFGLHVKDLTDEDFEKIRKKLEEKKITLGITYDEKIFNDLVAKAKQVQAVSKQTSKSLEATVTDLQRTAKQDTSEQEKRLRYMEREARIISDIQAKKERATRPVQQAKQQSRIQPLTALPYEEISYKNAQNQLRAYYADLQRTTKQMEQLSKAEQEAARKRSQLQAAASKGTAVNVTTYDTMGYKNSMAQLREYYKQLEQSSHKAAKQEERQSRQAQSDTRKRIADMGKILSQISRIENQIRAINSQKAIGGIDGTKTEKAIALLEKYKRALRKALDTGKTKGVLSGISHGAPTAALNQARLLVQQQRALNNEKKRTDALSHKEAQAAQRQVQNIRRTTEAMRSQSRLAGQLRNQLLDLYSVYAIERFTRSVIEIGGEFQKQHIALRSMLGDAAKADTMFSQIKELAIESPFNFRELMGFTKQVAAFGIPYEEMYETTKRLADISAGLGVDMGRIILAYGQVRSAAFLRGQELRQFTEAGIPLVDELAKKFTQLEGRVVSAGEVFEKISRREVSFGMVKDVLWQLTDEGGKFYNMQEALTESLSGKLAKLTDSYEMMLASIADGNNAILGGTLDMLTSLTSHWRGFLNLVLSLVSAYGAYKAATMVVNALLAGQIIAKKGLAAASALAATSLNAQTAATKGLNAQTARTILRVNGLKAAFAGLGNAGWIGVALGAIAAVGTYIYNATMDATRLRRALLNAFSQAANSATDAVAEYKALYTQLQFAVKGSEEYNAIIDKIQSRYGSYLGNLQREAYSYETLSAKIGSVTEALKAKAAEEARQKGLSAINDEYSEDVNDAVKALADKLQQNKNISKGMATGIATSFMQHIKDALSNGEAIDVDGLLSPILEKSGVVLSDFDTKFKGKSFNYVASNAQKLVNILSEVNLQVKSFDDILYNLSTSDYTKEIDRIAKARKKLFMQTPFKSEDEKREFQIETHTMQINAVKEMPGSQEAVADLQRQIEALQRFKDNWVQLVNAVRDETLQTEGLGKTFLDNIMPKEQQIQGGLNIEWLESLATAVDKAKTDLAKIEKLPADSFLNRANQETKKRAEAVLAFYENLKAKGVDALAFGKTQKTRGEEKPSSEDPVAEMWKQRLELVRKATDSYKQWSELEGKQKAKSRVRTMHPQAFDTSRMGFSLDVTNPTAALEYIKKQLSDLDKQKQLKLQIGVDIDKNAQDDVKSLLERMLKQAEAQIKDTTAKWDIYKSVLDKTGNKPFAMQLAFGQLEAGETDIMRGFRQKVEAAIKGTEFSFSDIIAMDEKAIQDAGLKAVQPFVDAYRDAQEQLRKETSDSLVELVSKYQDYSVQITEIERKLNEDIADMQKKRSMLQMGGVDVDKMVAERQKQAEEQKFSVFFADFKESSDWARIFDDLDRVSNATLDSMIAKLEQVAEQAPETAEEIKTIMEALGNLRDEKTDRNPFASFFSALKGIGKWKSADKQRKSGADLTYNSKTNKIEHKYTQKQIDDGLAEEQDNLTNSTAKIIEKFDALSGAADMLGGMFQALGAGDGLSTAAGILGGGMQGASQGMAIASSLSAAAGPWGAAAGAALSLVSGIAQIHDKKLEAFINKSKERVESLKDAFDQIDDSIERGLGGLRSSLALYDLLVEQSKRAGSSLSDSFSKPYEVLKDGGRSYMAQLDQQIRKQERFLRSYSLFLFGNKKFNAQLDLEAYTDLQKAGVGSNNLSNEQLKQKEAQYVSLIEQRKEVQKQLSAEQDKKNVDSGAVNDYQNQIAELNAEISYFVEDLTKELFGIDFSDWSSQISDSLVEAFANGEDAAEAFKDVTNNIMRSVANSMLKNMVIQPMFEKLQTKLFGDDTNDGIFETFEDIEGNGMLLADTLKNFFDNEGSKMISASQTFLESFDKATGGALKATGEKEEENKGLSASIAGITEDTADLLASYLNATRADVSIQRMMQEKFFNTDFPKFNAIAEAQLRQLDAIARNTGQNVKFVEEIRDILHRNINGNNKFSI